MNSTFLTEISGGSPYPENQNLEKSSELERISDAESVSMDTDVPTTESIPTDGVTTGNAFPSDKRVKSRQNYDQLRNMRGRFEKIIKNLKKVQSRLQTRVTTLKKKNVMVSEKNKALTKQNRNLSLVVNFQKTIIKHLDAYKSNLSQCQKRLFLSSMVDENSNKRAPRGCRTVVNSYYKKTLLQGQQQDRASKFSHIKSQVKNFYLDDENSTPSPGKHEFITRNKIKKGKRYLTDTQVNLWNHFCKKYKVKISRAFFFNLRPFWVVQPKISTRDTCLCKEHTNFKFLITKLHILKLLNVRNTTGCLQLAGCETLTADCVNRTCSQCKDFRIDIPADQTQKTTFYEEWIKETRSREGAGGKIYNVTVTTKRKVNCTVSKLVEVFFQILPLFLKHVHLVTHQYKALREISENLDFKEIKFGFDFSTNYVGKCREEVQSTNYGASKNQVSLQTGIFYYRDQIGQIQHVGFASVCDFLQHDAAAAWAYLEPVLDHLVELVPDVEVIHFHSDGPTSQYKNKRFLYLFTYFCKKYKLKKATHNYTAPGHGKGGGDAEGAVFKNACDRAVLSGSDVMCAQDMINIIRRNEKSKLKVFKIEKEDVRRVEKIIPENVGQVKKIASVYQVTWLNSNPKTLNLKYLSCHHNSATNSVCSHYNIYDYIYIDGLQNNQPTKVTVDAPSKTIQCMEIDDNSDDTAINEITGIDIMKYDIGDWIVVRYDGVWYPGIIININKKQELVTKFLSRSHSQVFWPKSQDVQKVLRSQVLCKINLPKTIVGKYVIKKETYDYINSMSKNCPVYEIYSR